MTRVEAQSVAIRWADKEIEARGAGAIFCRAPQPGKNVWTLREFREAAINDTSLVGCGMNPVDDIISLDLWCKEHGKPFNFEN